MIETSDLHKGTAIIFRGEPCMVVDCTFVSPGKGSAFTRTKLKSLKSGRVVDFTFKSGEKIEEAPIEIIEMSYLYTDGQDFYFMNPRNFSQYSLPADIIGTFKNFIKEGGLYKIIVLEDKAVSFQPPLKVRLKVIEAEEAVKGNTETSATKLVTLESGYKVNVPLFIKRGDVIAVNPQTGEYVERASG